MKKRIGILTGGGDVPPLNALIASAAETARAAGVELVGFIKGWQGILEENYVELAEWPLRAGIGGTILKSSRVGLGSKDSGRERALRVLDKLGIEGLIVVGGEDTLSNAFLLGGYRQVLIAKTIDNDVGKIVGGGDQHAEGFSPEIVLNYFTLGFPTAAEKIISFVSLEEGLRTTAYSHERIIIVESMGMHARRLHRADQGQAVALVFPDEDRHLWISDVFLREHRGDSLLNGVFRQASEIDPPQQWKGDRPTLRNPDG